MTVTVHDTADKTTYAPDEWERMFVKLRAMRGCADGKHYFVRDGSGWLCTICGQTRTR